MAKRRRYRNEVARTASYVTKLPLSTIASLEDRRLWHPLGALAPVAASIRSARRLIVAPHDAPGEFVGRYGSRLLNHRIAFSEPFRVAICVKRKMRREVLFALRFAGRGGSKKSYRRGPWSDVKC